MTKDKINLLKAVYAKGIVIWGTMYACPVQFEEGRDVHIWSCVDCKELFPTSEKNYECPCHRLPIEEVTAKLEEIITWKT
jgi:hypothetical protein